MPEFWKGFWIGVAVWAIPNLGCFLWIITMWFRDKGKPPTHQDEGN